MAEPKQKSIELPPSYLVRHIVPWQHPGWMRAEAWRNVAANQPVVGSCETSLIADVQSTRFGVTAREPKEEDKLADDIRHYTDVLNPELFGGLRGFDTLMALGLQDLLQIPCGANFEVIRWSNNSHPLSRDYKKNNPYPTGHVHRIAYMDGASIAPTFDKEYPLMQSIPQDANNRIFFRRNEIARIIMRARPEMMRWGYGMAPVEKVYMAIWMLCNSDKYYTNLLTDTPEAGLLDLGDMSAASARAWLQGFRELLTGIDALKIPVIYEHTTEVKFIPFTPPPVEMMIDTQSTKYQQITCSGYGLTLTDVGLGDPQKTLAGSIRDERRSRRSGFGVVKEKIRNWANDEILPDYLEFTWLENDEEARIQKGRSFLMSAQALEKAKNMNAVTDREVQAQLVKDGHITVEVEEPEEKEPPPMLPPSPNGKDGDNERTQEELERVPAAEGGRGEITGKAVQRGEGVVINIHGARQNGASDVVDIQQGPAIGDPTITAAPPDADMFDQLAAIFRQSFETMATKAGRPRLMRLIKAATRQMFPVASKALVELSEIEAVYWCDERLKMWFGEVSEFDDLPEVKKASDEVLDALEEILNSDLWWRIAPDEQAIILIYRLAFEQGATLAAEAVQEFLYTEGLRDSPSIIGLSFELKNPATLAELEAKAAQLVKRVNDGTKFFLKRIITAGVDEGLSSPNIAAMIKAGANADAVLREAGYADSVIRRAVEEIGGMSEGRLSSIVNTEVNRSESTGRLEQWRKMGLKRKMWQTASFDNVCPICRANEALGYVELDYVYQDVFDGTLAPPAHPQVCRCHIIFDETELISRSDELEIWTGD